MKIKKIIIKDFQSHKHTEFELANDFTCVMGEGNTGKSSIVRALSFFFFGKPWSENFIRKGQEVLFIEALLEDGVRVIREKGKKINRYRIIDIEGLDTTIENFGVNVPKEISERLGVFYLPVDDKDCLNLNISSQYDELFLISDVSSLRSKVLNRLTNAHHIDVGLRSLSSDKKNLSTQSKILMTNLSNNREALKKYDRLDLLRNDFEKFKVLLNQIEESTNKINYLKEIKVKKVQLEEDILLFKSKAKKHGRVPIESYKELYTYLEDYLKIVELKTEYLKVLDAIVNQNFKISHLTDYHHRELEVLKDELKDINICPLCNSILEGKKLYETIISDR